MTEELELGELAKKVISMQYKLYCYKRYRSTLCLIWYRLYHSVLFYHTSTL